MSKSAQPIEIKIKNRIYGKGRGWVFTQKDFDDLGAYFGIRKALLALTKDGFIRRIIQGVYDYPEQHKNLGKLPPNISSIAAALARRDRIKIQPSGTFAANLLGITEQVPAKVVYLTNGNSKSVKIGRQELIFKKTTPKRMELNNQTSGLVIEALRHLGKSGITTKTLDVLKRKLTSTDKTKLLKDAQLSPAWIRTIIEKEICDISQ